MLCRCVCNSRILPHANQDVRRPHVTFGPELVGTWLEMHSIMALQNIAAGADLKVLDNLRRMNHENWDVMLATRRGTCCKSCLPN